MDVSCEIVMISEDDSCSIHTVDSIGEWVVPSVQPQPDLPPVKLTLKRFNMNHMREISVVFIIGHYQTGKTSLVFDILRHTNYTNGLVFNDHSLDQRIYKKIVPPQFVHTEYSPDLVINYFRGQKEAIHKYVNEDPLYNPRGFIVWENCMDLSFWRDRAMRAALMLNRSNATTVIITMFWAFGIPQNMRTNADYVFIFRENIKSNRRKIYEQYFSGYTEYRIFDGIMDALRDWPNYTCLVLDLTGRTDKLEDFLFWYAAPPAKADFRMCAPALWEDYVEPPSPPEKNYDPTKKYKVDVYRG